MAPPFTRLLLASEHTDFDRGAEALAFALAQRCGLPLAAVLPVTSNPEYEAVAPQLAARTDAQAAARREALQAAAGAHAVALDLRVRRGAEPYAEIVAEARARGTDLLIIRRRGRRGLLANLLVGEMVSKVIAHAPCSVLVCPRDVVLWRRRVLAAIDPQAAQAGLVDCAAAVAAECALPLSLLLVVSDEAGRAAAQALLDGHLARLRAAGQAAQGEVRIGRAHQQIVAAAAQQQADLIVVGRHGPTRLDRAWIGGTAQKVMGQAECPVLVTAGPAGG